MDALEIIRVEAVRAADERRRHRMAEGRKAKAETGRKAVGAYRYGTQATGSGATRDAGPNEAEQETIRRILELRRLGGSYRQIAAVLDEEKRLPRRAEAWSAMAVRNIVVREG